MRILSLKNSEELANQTEALLEVLLKNKGLPLRGFLPAGSSAQGTYQRMIQHRDLWQGQVQFLQIDEFCEGKSNEATDNSFFLKNLREQILGPLNLEPQAETIKSNWSAQEFQNHIQKVTKSPIDFALLGLGPNGHIGFHEPGPYGADFLGGIVELTDESYRRVPGAPSKNALTFGAGSFLKADEIILLATGPGKEKIFESFLATAPTSKIPATLLKTHPKFTVLSTLNI